VSDAFPAFEQPCRHCGETRAWLLRPVHELDGVMPVDFVDGKARGWYEAIVCTGCGWTQFWAREYEPGRAPTTTAPCLDCGGTTGWSIEQVPDLTADHSATFIDLKLARLRFKPSLLFSFGAYGWRGTLAVHICAGCAVAAWSCRAAATYAEDLRPPRPSPRACRRCHGEQLVTLVDDCTSDAIAPSHRARAIFAETVQRRVAGPLREVQEGRFVLEVCRTCFAVEWHAIDRDEVHEHTDKGVFRLDRDPSKSGGSDGGPYR
jgi:hypothetical protein